MYLVGQASKTRLAMYDIDDKKESTILTGVRAYALSRDGKKVLYRAGDDYGIVDVKADQKTTDGLLATARTWSSSSTRRMVSLPQRDSGAGRSDADSVAGSSTFGRYTLKVVPWPGSL